MIVNILNEYYSKIKTIIEEAKTTLLSTTDEDLNILIKVTILNMTILVYDLKNQIILEEDFLSDENKKMIRLINYRLNAVQNKCIVKGGNRW